MSYDAEEPYTVTEPEHLPHVLVEADSGVVTPAELEDIITRHLRGEYRRHEMRMGRWEI